MAEVTLESVTKEFEDGDETVVAVDDVSIDIEDGEFLVLVGPSGCGKSTTLRMIAGLETVTSGTISIDDEVVNHVPAQRRDIAMVFQSYALYPHMTVRGNMAFGLEESTTIEREVIDRRVAESADMMGIGDLLDRKPADLSGGQRQRVALGRAIVRDPEVFLMDEPLSNLDAKLRAQMRTELQRLQAELGTTTIYVTHDQTEAMTMGDRIAILDGGELQQVGTPLECYHRPNNQFVAGFVGDPPMNFIDATNEDGVLDAGAFDYPLPSDIADAVEGREELVLGIRPEDIVLGPNEAQTEHVLEATVDVVEPTGDENVVYLALTDEAMTDATGGALDVGRSGDTDRTAGSSTSSGGAGGGILGRIAGRIRAAVGGTVAGDDDGTQESTQADEDANVGLGSDSAARIVTTVGGMRQYESGQSVTVYLPPDAIHLFDANTSEAVHNRQLETVEEATGV